MLPPLLAACILPVNAENLYRCVSPGGQASYRQAPRCPRGQRLDRIIAYRPEPDATQPPPVFKPVAPPRARAPTARSGSVAGGTKRGRRQMTASERCRAAKEQRERAFRKLGLKRTYDDLGRLDAPVRAACRW